MTEHYHVQLIMEMSKYPQFELHRKSTIKLISENRLKLENIADVQKLNSLQLKHLISKHELEHWHSHVSHIVKYVRCCHGSVNDFLPNPLPLSTKTRCAELLRKRHSKEVNERVTMLRRQHTRLASKVKKSGTMQKKR